MLMKLFVDVTTGPRSASFRQTDHKTSFHSFKPFCQIRNEAFVGRQVRGPSEMALKWYLKFLIL